MAASTDRSSVADLVKLYESYVERGVADEAVRGRSEPGRAPCVPLMAELQSKCANAIGARHLSNGDRIGALFWFRRDLAICTRAGATKGAPRARAQRPGAPPNHSPDCVIAHRFIGDAHLCNDSSPEFFIAAIWHYEQAARLSEAVVRDQPSFAVRMEQWRVRRLHGALASRPRPLTPRPRL